VWAVSSHLSPDKAQIEKASEPVSQWQEVHNNCPYRSFPSLWPHLYNV